MRSSDVISSAGVAVVSTPETPKPFFQRKTIKNRFGEGHDSGYDCKKFLVNGINLIAIVQVLEVGHGQLAGNPTSTCTLPCGI
jgi:hypothetical protein